jgi:competence protein ComEA
LASAIVQYRDQNGPFQSVDELLEVPGIGPTRLAQLREMLQVE